MSHPCFLFLSDTSGQLCRFAPHYSWHNTFYTGNKDNLTRSADNRRVISMFIGSLMLFESPGPFMKLSLAVILPSVIMTALFFTIVIGLAYKAYKKKPITGSEGLIGLKGIADTDITNEGGMVALHGELWSAVSDE